MVTTAHNPRAWAVATALAAESGLDWAAWARGETAPQLIDECERGCGGRDPECAQCHYTSAGPVPAPWDADAYRADCARRGVEPGPLPSLEYGDAFSLSCAPDGVVRWSVDTDEVFIVVGSVSIDMTITGKRAGRVAVSVDSPRATVEDLAKAAALATAAKRAIGT